METPQPLQFIDYEGFVARICAPGAPAPRLSDDVDQERAIRDFLAYMDTPFWHTLAGAGKTHVLRWLIQYLIDLEREQSGGWNDWMLVERIPDAEQPTLP